eukprot:CAMPEP_0197926322 /NCGR_PEP_ID=MMETSP1439-20131203/98950_1 /TAXON_ID=66791 /ORGANISM="Gonyaulax spinifera, Strain CCMP409" /LENGTH=34 /DNA_ID= /DNA_START= /DNA_END= /DNA_ORIENTATION=
MACSLSALLQCSLDHVEANANALMIMPPLARLVC